MVHSNLVLHEHRLTYWSHLLTCRGRGLRAVLQPILSDTAQSSLTFCQKKMETDRKQTDSGSADGVSQRPASSTSISLSLSLWCSQLDIYRTSCCLQPSLGATQVLTKQWPSSCAARWLPLTGRQDSAGSTGEPLRLVCSQFYNNRYRDANKVSTRS